MKTNDKNSIQALRDMLERIRAEHYSDIIPSDLVEEIIDYQIKNQDQNHEEASLRIRDIVNKRLNSNTNA